MNSKKDLLPNAFFLKELNNYILFYPIVCNPVPPSKNYCILRNQHSLAFKWCITLGSLFNRIGGMHQGMHCRRWTGNVLDLSCFIQSGIVLSSYRCCLRCGDAKVKFHTAVLPCQFDIVSVDIPNVCPEDTLKQFISSINVLFFDFVLTLS